METLRTEQVSVMLSHATSIEHLPFGIPHLREYADELEPGDIIYIPEHPRKFVIKDELQANTEKGFALCVLIKADHQRYDFTFFPSFLITTVAVFSEDGEIIDEAENSGSAYDFALQCWENYGENAVDRQTEADYVLKELEGKAIKINAFRLVNTQKITGFHHGVNGETVCEVDETPDKVFDLELLEDFKLED